MNSMLFPWDGPAVGLFSKPDGLHDLCLVTEFRAEERCYRWKYIHIVGHLGLLGLYDTYLSNW